MAIAKLFALNTNAKSVYCSELQISVYDVVINA